MNAKEEVLKLLKSQLKSHNEVIKNASSLHVDKEAFEELRDKTEYLITAVENAIFDVPSFDEELFKELWYKRNPCHDININTQKDMFYETAFCVFVDFLNYKKQSDPDLFDTPIKYSSKMKEYPIMKVIKPENNGK